MTFKNLSFMSKNLTSENIEEDKFNRHTQENDYKNLITRLNEIKTKIAVLRKIIFK